MNILLLFATNSGSTMDATSLVKNLLETAGHTVTLKNPKESSFDELTKTDCIVIASPSWDYEGKEGQPHEDFDALLKELEGKSLEGKSFAILGLGDSSYTHFCGAVDIFESMVQGAKGKLIVSSLRVDRFYQKRENPDLVKSWAEQLSSALQAA
jgi:flavodoxin